MRVLGYILGCALICTLSFPSFAEEPERRTRVIPSKVPAYPPPFQGRVESLETSKTVITPKTSIGQSPSQTQAKVIEPFDAVPAIVVAPDPVLYSRPTRTAPISADELLDSSTSGAFAGKIRTLDRQVRDIDTQTHKLAERLAALQRRNDAGTREYYANVATILAQLQAGTTPANPRLVARMNEAEGQLEKLSRMLGEYARLSRHAGGLSSRALSVSQEADAALSLPGAEEEDHQALLSLQDSIARSMVSVERVGRTVTNDITRAGRYEQTERANLRMLSLAVERGEIYGIGPGNLLESREILPLPQRSRSKKTQEATVPQTSWQPLLRVTFDKPDVAYEAPLHAAVRDALAKYPKARFEMISVYPAPAWEGQSATAPAQAAALDRQAIQMRDTLTRMGLPPERVHMSSRWGKDPSGEIYLYLVPS